MTMISNMMITLINRVVLAANRARFDLIIYDVSVLRSELCSVHGNLEFEFDPDARVQ